MSLPEGIDDAIDGMKTAMEINRETKNELNIAKQRLAAATAQLNLMTNDCTDLKREFEIAIADAYEDIQHRDDAIRRLSVALAQIEERLDVLANSRSFKLGRAISYPYRLLRDGRTRAKLATLDKEIRLRRRAISNGPSIEGGVNLGDQLSASFGQHRSGWHYAVNALTPLYNPDGICLDTFIERTFVWHPDGPQTIEKPWIGFIHVPPNVPSWFDSHVSNDAIFQSEEWRRSLPYCRGLFTLSVSHKEALEERLDIPVNALLHPTDFRCRTWSWEQFKENKDRKIVQVGWWLRKLHAIYELPPCDFTKVFLRVSKDDKFQRLFEHERRLRVDAGKFDDSMYGSAVTVDYLSNEDYDRLLSENIVFLDLYDSSANNTVIECIARCTPMLINPLTSVREYLGDEYPLYYNNYEEAIAKAEDHQLVRDTHEYLKSSPRRQLLTAEYFRKSFEESPIYRDNA